MADSTKKAPPPPKAREDDGKEAPKAAPPARSMRIGLVWAKIWANQTAAGVVYNVTFERSWKEPDTLGDGGEVLKEGEWHKSSHFGRDDLLVVAKLADAAHTWIIRETQDRHQGSL